MSIKSGNACVLRGGSEAIESNRALAQLVAQALTEAGLPAHAVQLVPTTDRAAVGLLITMPQCIDVIIPRGGKSLIERISQEAKVPVIKHLDGNCHTLPLVGPIASECGSMYVCYLSTAAFFPLFDAAVPLDSVARTQKEGDTGFFPRSANIGRIP